MLCSGSDQGQEEEQGVERGSHHKSKRLVGRVSLPAHYVQPCLVFVWRHIVASLHCNKPASDCRYPAVYVFKHDNLRNDKFKELREELKDTSRSASLSSKPFRGHSSSARQGNQRGGTGLTNSKLCLEERCRRLQSCIRVHTCLSPPVYLYRQLLPQHRPIADFNPLQQSRHSWEPHNAQSLLTPITAGHPGYGADPLCSALLTALHADHAATLLCVQPLSAPCTMLVHCRSTRCPALLQVLHGQHPRPAGGHGQD